MFGSLATIAVGISRSFGRMLGNELAVVVTPHKINLEMVDPDKTDRDWDETLYTHGNIYFRGFANPIKPKFPDTEEHAREEMELELISSDRYKQMMEQTLMQDIIEEGTPDSGLTLSKVLVILAVLQVTMTGALAYLII